MRRLSPLLLLDVAAKLALLTLLLVAVARPDLQQFAGKAMTGRAVAYPLAVLIVPAVWALRGRRRPFPAALDLLLTLPFLIDTAGNAADLYDSIGWWDDANHFVNWALLTGGICQHLRLQRHARGLVLWLAIGFGGVTAVLWEFAEYVTFIRHSDELATAYTDTLGDLALGLAGSALAAVLTVLIRWPGASALRRAAPTP